MKNKKDLNKTAASAKATGEPLPVDFPSNKPCPVLLQMRKNKKKTLSSIKTLAKQENQNKKYRVTYTTCTDIENDYFAKTATEAKAMFCKHQGFPVKDFIHKLKAKELK